MRMHLRITYRERNHGRKIHYHVLGMDLVTSLLYLQPELPVEEPPNVSK